DYYCYSADRSGGLF
nr:immunoglobulin light chain junction region [Macaca mulatta]MOW06021.1 immunoglobulin light chain junction region [Macaca mulatta]MOW06179.1 immunoglobulin light chain junction region [Macaca mulatta]